MSTPEYKEQKKPVPKANKRKTPAPKVTDEMIPVPEYQEEQLQTPEYEQEQIPVPEYQTQKIPAPHPGLTENQVLIDGVLIQVKPTKLKYHRDQTTVFYKILRQAPVVEILSLDDDFFGNKTPDKLLFDWLVAVLDDPDFVTEHYDNFTTENIDKLLQIFCRLNGFDQREERKNRQAQGAGTNH